MMPSTTERVAAATAAAAGVLALVVGAVVSQTGIEPIVEALTPSPSAQSSTEPSSSAPSPAPDGTNPPVSTTIDPAFGDVVIAATRDDSAQFDSGLTLELLSVTETTATGQGIGGTSGEAVTVELRMTNTSTTARDIAPVVNAYLGEERVPLSPAGEEDGFAATMGPGESAIAHYTFATDDADGTLWVTVSIGAESGLVVFEYR